MNEKDELIKQLGDDLHLNENLAKYTTMKVGGPAKYFYFARKIDDLIRAITISQELKIPFFVLGSGSNIIFGDDGYHGLVILNRTDNIAFMNDKAQVIVDSGVSLMRLITESANHDLGGLEPLYGIPGTVGGAVYGNVGAYGLEISHYIKSITVLKSDNKIARYKTDWLDPKYRSTKIKQDKKKYKKSLPVVLSVTFQLMHQKNEEIVKKLQHYKKLREEKQPYNFPSAGSIFKNVGTEKEKTAGYILEQVGAKKIKIGGAEVSNKHANFIINTKNATADDVKNIITQMKILAHDNYGVELEEEVEIV